jgi:hypothetical protein
VPPVPATKPLIPATVQGDKPNHIIKQKRISKKKTHTQQQQQQQQQQERKHQQHKNKNINNSNQQEKNSWWSYMLSEVELLRPG